MNDIIVIAVNGELRTDSRLLASKLDHRHRTILENIDKYQARFLQLGRLPFETGTIETRGGRQAQRYALLNEDQCYFLLTLMRNNEKIVDGKLALVKSFRDARTQLAARDQARIEGKKIRHQETDSIKELVEYAKGQGSKSAEMYYASVTKMTNKALNITAGMRDKLPPHALKQLSVAETIVDLSIRDGIRAGLEYKDIYRLAKQRVADSLQSIGIEGGEK